jgi:phage recombination protein Bet
MTTELATQEAPSLLKKMAAQYEVEPNKMLATLKATAFRGEVSNEQMMALLIVANQHGLNPWTKEIYAFPDKNNGIVPVVGVDGWARIINSHPAFDGMDFVEAEDGSWCDCIIHRKDRAHPVKVREYLIECKRNTSPWGTHPRRMLRHKTMIQCARVAFSYSGIYDPDEAERIVEGERLDEPPKRLGLGTTAFLAATEPSAPASPAESSGAPPAPPSGQIPTVGDVRILMDKGDYDGAADLARSFPEAARKALEREIAAKAKKATAA